jgi:hypothetical protein
MMITLARIRRFLTLHVLGDGLLLLGLLGLAAAGVLALIELGGGRGARADGVIIGLSNPPVVQFMPHKNGEPVQFTSDTRTTFWNAGDHVTVAYNSDDPRDAKIEGLTGRWFVPFVFGFWAIICLAAGAICTLMGRIVAKRRRQR